MHLREEMKLPWAEIAKRFPGHSYTTLKAVVNKIRAKEGRLRKAGKLWIPEEDAVIRRLRLQGANNQTISLALPGRTTNAVRDRRRNLEMSEKVEQNKKRGDK